MPRPTVVLAVVLLFAVPGVSIAKGPLPEPDDGPDPRGMTLSGAATVRVAAPARRTEETIQRAVNAAKARAIPRAVARARDRAQALAAAAGLTLGEIRAVSERPPEPYYFGTQRYCRTLPANGRPLRGPRCTVPAFTSAMVTATFATSETEAATPAGRAIAGTESASAPVRPRNRRSSASIADALLRGRRQAAPLALAAARRDAEAAGRAAGMQPGALFSIAEVREPFGEQQLLGTFGPGRFCGTVSRAIVRRDAATGRRRVVRRVRTRRCFFPSRATVTLRVTMLPV